MAFNPFGSFGDAFIRIRPNFAGFEAAVKTGVLGTLESTLLGVGEALQDLGKTISKRFAIPLGIAIAANITQWQALDAQIRETLTLFGSGGTAVVTTQFDEMRDGVYEVSEALGVLEQGVSEGLYQALSAGVPRDNVFEFLQTGQQAAIAGATDLFTTVDGLTTAVNSFASSGLTASDAADILFRGVARGKTTLEELASDMARVAPLVAATGTEFDEFVAIVSTMTIGGTKTSEAFSGLKAAIAGMLRPSEQITAVWEKYNLSSGDAAINTLGLQGAMELLVQETGGSNSKLIELLGNVEGMNAILQVTGDNADLFASVMRDTGNAAGAMDQAFDTMQEGVGRSFGRMTAAFDRLGSVGGDMASGFVVPLVDAITGAVSTMADWGRAVGDALEPIAETWGSIVKTITGNRVFKGLVATVGSLVVGFTALVGVLGPLALVLGTVFVKFVQLSRISSAMTVLFGPLTKAFSAFSTALYTGGLRMQNTGASLITMANASRAGSTALSTTAKTAIASGAAVQGMGARMTAASLGMQKFFSALTPGVLLAVTAAAAGLVWGISKLNEQAKKWRETAEIATTGADKLGDSLGLVVKNLGEIDFPGLEQLQDGIDIGFRTENADQINEIRRTMETFGLDAAQNTVFNIALRWVAQGNTPEDSMAAIRTLVQEGGLDIPITFGADDLQGDDALLQWRENVLGLVDSLGTEVEARTGEMVRGFEIAPQVDSAATQRLASELAAMFQLGQFESALDVMAEMSDLLSGMGAGVEGDFFDDVVLAIEAATGEKMDVSLNNIRDFESFLQELANAGKITADEFENITGSLDSYGDRVRSLPEPNLDLQDKFAQSAARSAGSVVNLGNAQNEAARKAREQDEALGALSSRMTDTFAAASDLVAERQGAIRESFLETMPLLDEYGGALDQTFADWEASQNQFQEDFLAWQTKSADILGALPAEVAERIKKEPMSVKAWLASLGDANLETAIAELTETYGLVSGAAESEIVEQMPAIIREAEELIQDEYNIMEKDARDAGFAVADGFDTQFQVRADSWAASVNTYATQAKNALYDVWGISSPSKVAMGAADNIANSFSSQLSRHSGAGMFGLPGGLDFAAGAGGSFTEGSTEIHLHSPTAVSIEEGTRVALERAALQKSIRRNLR